MSNILLYDVYLIIDSNNKNIPDPNNNVFWKYNEFSFVLISEKNELCATSYSTNLEHMKFVPLMCVIHENLFYQVKVINW